jgi:3-oxoacyl-[acyl-carrier-protein] synthase-3
MKIKAIHGYLPKNIITSEELDGRFGWAKGTAFKRSGVSVRSFVRGDETGIDMAESAFKCLSQSITGENNIIPEPEVLIGTSGTALQALPFNATFYKSRLYPSGGGFPAFDVNSSCLSFVWGLQVGYALPFTSILLITSDVASCGLNWDNWESSLIFGDGAVACWLDKSSRSEFTFHFSTFSEGKQYCQIRAGGSLRHPLQVPLERKDFLFSMDGKRLFRLVSKHIDNFVIELLWKAKITMSDIDLVIPHQASALAMQHIRKQLNLSEDQIMDIFSTHGNQVATSIPMALFRAAESGRLKRGDRVMLIGTSAGVSIGGAIFIY